MHHPGQQYQEEISSYLMESDFSGTTEAIFEVPSFLCLFVYIFGGAEFLPFLILIS